MSEPRTHGDEMKSSDESSRPEIVLGKAEGSAYGAALAYLSKMEASDAGEQTIDDYVVAYAIEDAEGLYEMKDGELTWVLRPEDNCHIEIAVRSAGDGRFLPGLNVTVTLADSRGNEIGTHKQPFLWHPWIYHYGRNWSVPGSGEYRLRVHIDAPDFPRHDKVNGLRFQKAVHVEFSIRIKTGQKVPKAA